MNDSWTVPQQQPTPATRQAFARWAARLSLFAPLVAISFQVLVPEPRLRETKLIVGSLGMLTILAGLILAIIALASAQKHCRKGILGYAVAGIIVNGLLTLIGVAGTILLIPALRRVGTVSSAGYTTAELEEMPRVIADSRIVIDRAIGFRIEIPGDFEDNPQPQPPRVLYSFLRMDPNGRNIGINIDRLEGRIRKEPLGPEAIAAMQSQLPAGSEVEHILMSWKTYQLDTFVIRFRMDDTVLCSYAVQVPLAHEAIQINVAGPVELSRECQELTALLLAGLKGLSDWDPLPVLQEDAGTRWNPR